MAGLLMGQKFRGLVGQGMDGRKSYRDASVRLLKTADPALGNASVTATAHCTALVYAWGGGGSGADEAGGSIFAGGGGGGAALFKTVRLSRGQVVTWSIGAWGAAAMSGTTGNSGGDTPGSLCGTRIAIPSRGTRRLR